MATTKLTIPAEHVPAIRQAATSEVAAAAEKLAAAADDWLMGRRDVEDGPAAFIEPIDDLHGVLVSISWGPLEVEHDAEIEVYDYLAVQILEEARQHVKDSLDAKDGGSELEKVDRYGWILREMENHPEAVAA